MATYPPQDQCPPQQPLLAQPYPSYQSAPIVMVDNHHHHHRNHPPYDVATALILCAAPAVLCGVCGCHQMYLGNVGIGVCQCLTLGGCGVWSLIDAISMRQIVDEANRREGYFGDCETITTPTYVQGAPAGVYGYAPLPTGTVIAQPQPAYPQPQSYQAAYPAQPVYFT